MFKRVGNSFLSGALITWPPLQDSLFRGIFPSTPILVPPLLSFPFIFSLPPTITNGHLLFVMGALIL